VAIRMLLAAPQVATCRASVCLSAGRRRSRCSRTVVRGLHLTKVGRSASAPRRMARYSHGRSARQPRCLSADWDEPDRSIWGGRQRLTGIFGAGWRRRPVLPVVASSQRGFSSRPIGRVLALLEGGRRTFRVVAGTAVAGRFMSERGTSAFGPGGPFWARARAS